MTPGWVAWVRVGKLDAENLFQIDEPQRPDSAKVDTKPVLPFEIFLRAAPKAALLPFTWLRHQCWTLTPAHLLSAGPDSGLELPSLGWHCHLADVYSAFSTSLMVPKPELLLMSASRSVLLLDCSSQIQMETEQSILTPGSILFPKRRNPAAFLRERREQCWGPCLTSPAYLRSVTARTKALPSFFFTAGKNTPASELPACALTKGESRWEVFITLGIWDSLQLFCEELLSFSVSRFPYPFWEEAADKMMVWHLILREFWTQLKTSTEVISYKGT